ncbi:hypothetical protein [Nostoc sp.]
MRFIASLHQGVGFKIFFLVVDELAIANLSYIILNLEILECFGVSV